MKHIFYFFTCVAIAYEFTIVTRTRMMLSFLTSVHAKHDSGKDIDYTITESKFLFCMMCYFLWTFFGIAFTDQWFLFSVIMLWSIAMSKLKDTLIMLWIDGAFSLTVLLFILLNEYHFHLDPFRIVTDKVYAILPR